MMREDIPKVLFSCIKKNDPYKSSKILQIEHWCYVNWHLHEGYGKKIQNFIAQILSSEDVWKKVDNLHGVKLNRHIVGRKLIASDNHFGEFDKYDIACKYCLEEEIFLLFDKRKTRLSAQGKISLLEYGNLVRSLRGNLLIVFWSHFVSGYINKLNLHGYHLYEYGLDCAMALKRAEAVEFFWEKIKLSPEYELSAKKKEEIFMRTAVRAAEGRYSNYPEIFEFLFSEVNPDKYPEIVKRDFDANSYYGSFSSLQDALRFDLSKKLFDYLKPSNVSEMHYFVWLKDILKSQNFSEYCKNEGFKLFMHMWTKEGFHNHRSFLIKKEMSNSVFQGEFLVTLITMGCMEPVWAILNEARPEQIKEFMDSRHANRIGVLLKKKRDKEILDKFLSYSNSANDKASNGDINS